MGLFIVLAHIPAYKTKVMWWVDLAWPFGLVLIGVYTFLITGAPTLKAKLICACYFFQGIRMGLGAIYLIRIGRWKVGVEIQRYEYQKIKYEKRNGKNTWNMAHMQKEIFL